MKHVTWMLFLGLLFMPAIAQLPAQDQDLSGTWVGSTAVPGMEERDNLTLVLKKDGSSYSGTLSDSMGMLTEAVLEKVKVDMGAISFEFLAQTGGGPVRIRSTLKASEGKLVGSWESEGGDTGALEFVRKK